MELPKKIKRKWLKALRSGEYAQTKGTLTNGKGGFCCLGVLQHCVDNGQCEVDVDNNYRVVPSKAWYAEHGIKHGSWKDKDIQTLVEMNDGWQEKQANFKEIADYIEANIKTTD